MSPATEPSYVVIAEDDADVRRALCRLLEFEGYLVERCHTGAQLLEMIDEAVLDGKKRAPDAIITDMRMPGINGLHLVEDLRRMGIQIPVVIITAYGSGEVRERVKQLSRVRLMEKPFDPLQLVQELNALMA